MAVSAALALTGALVVLAPPAAAGTTSRAFTPVFTANTTGDITIRGNTLLSCSSGSVNAGGSTDCASVQSGATSQYNNNYKMAYVDSDGTTGGNTTFDSSSATVTVPTGSTVLYAGLSWGGNTVAGSLSNYPTYSGVAAPNSSAKGTVSFMTPTTGYSTVTSTTTDANGTNYQGFADVTDAVSAAGSGVYTVANVQAGTGAGNDAGWSLAVAYSNPTLPSRNLVIFTGFDTVSGSASAVDIPVSGFTTPATGQVRTTLGVVGYEGDRGQTGDSLSVGSTALSNSLNPANDIFNSTITDLNTEVTNKTPNYENTLGFDVDRFDATGALANSSTSTTIHLTTSGETYYPGMLTFATDLNSSALTAAKTVTDVNGGTVARNDVLTYTVTVTNGGNNGAAATVLSDAVPIGTAYVANSLKIGGTSATDAAGDDTGEVSAGNVTARLGTGATASAGGLLAPTAASTVSFQVTVGSSLADGTVLSNTATFNSNDQTTGVGTGGGSNTVTSAVVVPPSLYGSLASGEAGAAYSSTLSKSSGTGTGPFVWSISSGTLPAGLSISASTGTISGTPTTAGTSNVTVLVTDVNNRTGTRSSSITVIAGPSVSFNPPSGEVGAAYTATPTATGGTGPYTWAVSVGTLPSGLTIDTSTGAITGTPTGAGSTDVTVQVTDAKSVTAVKAVTIAIASGPTLTFPTLPAGELTAAYSTPLTVAGGTSPYTWSISIGTLPAGITLNPSTGVLSGTPTAIGTSAFTVRAIDSFSQVTTKTASITVAAALALTFAAPPSGEVSVAYSDQLTLAGGVGPYVWSVSAGTLPAGVTLNPATGLLSGAPTASGTASFTVAVTDAINQVATRAATVVVAAAPALTFSAPPAGVIGTDYSDQLTFSGGVGPFVWSISTGTLPAGVTLNAATGLLSGTPTAAGTASFTVRIVDGNSVADTRAATIVIAKIAATITGSADTSVQFGTAITLHATLTPSAAGGTVTFTDVPTTGPQQGNTITIATSPLTTGTASTAVVLPAFGVNTITATYNGDTTYTTTSTTFQVEVSAYAGEVIITEFRQSGPSGNNDGYVELFNTGAPVPLAGMVVAATSGATTTLPDGAGILGTHRSYLLTGNTFSLGSIATSDSSSALGNGGFQVTAPDTALTQTDAVGPADGFHLGTGLAAIIGYPTAQYAWVRTELAGAPVDSRDNAADFQLVSSSLALVRGVQPTLGSASPTGTADPFQHNSGMTSTLLDTSVSAAAAPNRVVLAGPPRLLVVRRTITNTSGAEITAAKIRISALSEQFGAPEPGVGSQPTRVADLRVVNPAASTEQVTLTGGAVVTVQNLSVDYPITAALGGGLNSTLTVPLPGGGLDPGASINVAFTFAIDTSGTFWFGYDVDAITGLVPTVAPARRPAVARRTAALAHHDRGRVVTPRDSGRVR